MRHRLPKTIESPNFTYWGSSINTLFTLWKFEILGVHTVFVLCPWGWDTILSGTLRAFNLPGWYILQYGAQVKRQQLACERRTRLRYSFFWNVMQRSLVIGYWDFEKTSHISLESSWGYSIFTAGTDRFSRKVGEQLPTYVLQHFRRTKASNTKRRKAEISSYRETCRSTLPTTNFSHRLTWDWNRVTEVGSRSLPF